ncbi:MAG TPA: lysylphosphatidylglycerol synthase domain-containing protein [Gaiellaceae bacterium]|nr:lysylphosphatidylglycerol synthase domain-containing protein [Gaiellaceae bacterium]
MRTALHIARPLAADALHIARPLAAVATLAIVVWRLGAGPFLDGVRAVDGRALLAASAIGVVTTLCCAWRWTIVARGLGIRLPLSPALAAYYRSLFLNLTLPGGVVGDVHRGVAHGNEVRDVGRGLRAVVWERGAGQVVQALLTVPVLLVLASPVRSITPIVVAALLVTVAGVVVFVRARGMRPEVRLSRKAWAAVAFASAVVVVGHAATFVVAARVAGVTASLVHLLPLAFLAMLAMVLPSIAGWGPREGATAWVFSAAGLGADRGAATAVAYGVMVLAASLPGAIVLLAGWLPGVRVPLRGATDA